MKDVTIREQVSEWSCRPTKKDLAKIQDDEFKIGERVTWMYVDDLIFLRGFKEKVNKKNWRKHTFYEGIVVPLEGVESRRSFDSYDILNDVMIVGTTYPAEKCNPDVEWFALGQLICEEDLVWFGKLES